MLKQKKRMSLLQLHATRQPSCRGAVSICMYKYKYRCVPTGWIYIIVDERACGSTWYSGATESPETLRCSVPPKFAVRWRLATAAGRVLWNAKMYQSCRIDLRCQRGRSIPLMGSWVKLRTTKEEVSWYGIFYSRSLLGLWNSSCFSLPPFIFSSLS